MYSDLDYKSDINYWNELDVYFTLNEKIELLNSELKRARRNVVVNQFIRNHFIGNNPYDTGNYWVDDEYIKEFDEKLYSYMLHYECIKSTIVRIKNEIKQVEVIAKKREEENTVRIDISPEQDEYVEKHNSEYDGEYYIGNDKPTSYEQENIERYSENDGIDFNFDEEDEVGGENEFDDEDEDADEDGGENEFDDEDEDADEDGGEGRTREEKEDINTQNWVNNQGTQHKEYEFPLLPGFFLNRIISLFTVSK